MSYTVQKSGNTFQVIDVETKEVHSTHKTKKQADEQVKTLNEKIPDTVKVMPDGTKASVTFKNKEKYNGPII